MKTRSFLACVLLILATTTLRAQQPGDDPIGQNFFAPDLVIQHQEAIGLNDEQRTYLKTEIRQAQAKFTELQWKLQDEMEKLTSLVKQPHVDEQETLAQLEKVLAAEREIKRTQVALLVRIKNKLTPEQQAKLTDIRGKSQVKQ
jgi:Spy/CpxP family protein refolding chaperone